MRAFALALLVLASCTVIWSACAEPVELHLEDVTLADHVEYTLQNTPADGIRVFMKNVVSPGKWVWFEQVKVLSIFVENVLFYDNEALHFQNVNFADNCTIEVINYQCAVDDGSWWTDPLVFSFESIGDNVFISVRDSYLAIDRSHNTEYYSTSANAGLQLWRGEWNSMITPVEVRNLTVELSNNTFTTHLSLKDNSLIDNSGYFMNHILCTACILTIDGNHFNGSADGGHVSGATVGTLSAFVDSNIVVKRNAVEGVNEGTAECVVVSFNFKGAILNSTIEFSDNNATSNTTDSGSSRQFAANLIVGDITVSAAVKPFYNNDVRVHRNVLSATSAWGSAANILILGSQAPVPGGLHGVMFSIENNVLQSSGFDYVDNVGVHSFTRADGLVQHNNMTADGGSLACNVGLNVFSDADNRGPMKDRSISVVHEGEGWHVVVVNNALQGGPRGDFSGGVVVGNPNGKFVTSTFAIQSNNITQDAAAQSVRITLIEHEAITVNHAELKSTDTFDSRLSRDFGDIVMKQRSLKPLELRQRLDTSVSGEYEPATANTFTAPKRLWHSGVSLCPMDDSMIKVAGNLIVMTTSSATQQFSIQVAEGGLAHSQLIVEDNVASVQAAVSTVGFMVIGNMDQSNVSIRGNQIQCIARGTASARAITYFADSLGRVFAEHWTESLVDISHNKFTVRADSGAAAAMHFPPDPLTDIKLDFSDTTILLTHNVIDVHNNGTDGQAAVGTLDFKDTTNTMFQQYDADYKREQVLQQSGISVLNRDETEDTFQRREPVGYELEQKLQQEALQLLTDDQTEDGRNSRKAKVQARILTARTAEYETTTTTYERDVTRLEPVAESVVRADSDGIILAMRGAGTQLQISNNELTSWSHFANSTGLDIAVGTISSLVISDTVVNSSGNLSAVALMLEYGCINATTAVITDSKFHATQRGVNYDVATSDVSAAVLRVWTDPGHSSLLQIRGSEFSMSTQRSRATALRHVNWNAQLEVQLLVGTSLRTESALMDAGEAEADFGACLRMEREGGNDWKGMHLLVDGVSMRCADAAIVVFSGVSNISESTIAIVRSDIEARGPLLAAENSHIDTTDVTISRNRLNFPPAPTVDARRRKLLAAPAAAAWSMINLPLFVLSPTHRFIVQCNSLIGRFMKNLDGAPLGTVFLDCTDTVTKTVSRNRTPTPTRERSASATKSISVAPPSPSPPPPPPPPPPPAISGDVTNASLPDPLAPGGCTHVKFSIVNSGGPVHGTAELFFVAKHAHVLSWGFSAGTELCREVNGSRFVAERLVDEASPEAAYFICAQPAEFRDGSQHTFWMDVTRPTNTAVVISRMERTLVSAPAQHVQLSRDTTAALRAVPRTAFPALTPVAAPTAMDFEAFNVMTHDENQEDENVAVTSLGEVKIPVSSGSFAVESFKPSLRDICVPGREITIEGRDLHRAPPAVFYGPLLLPLRVVDAGRRATFTVPERIVVPQHLMRATKADTLRVLQSREAMVELMRANIPQDNSSSSCVTQFLDTLVVESPEFVDPLVHVVGGPTSLGDWPRDPVDVTSIRELCHFTPTCGLLPRPTPEIVVSRVPPELPTDGTLFVCTFNNPLHPSSPLPHPPTVTVAPGPGITAIIPTLVEGSNGTYTVAFNITTDDSTLETLTFNVTIALPHGNTTHTITFRRVIPVIAIQFRRTQRFAADAAINVTTLALAKAVELRLTPLNPPVPVFLRSADRRCVWNRATVELVCTIGDVDGRVLATSQHRRNGHGELLPVIAVEADVARYFSRAITLEAVATARNAARVRAEVRILPAAATGSNAYADDGDLPPEALIDTAPGDGAPPGSAPVAATPPPVQHMSSAIRSIFEPNGCLGTVNFLLMTCVVFAVLLLLRQLYHMVRRRRDGRLGLLQIATHDIGRLAALLPLHAWVAPFAPHHHHSGTLQLTITFVHVLAFYAFGSTLYNMFGLTIATPLHHAVALGFFTAMLATAVQPLSHFLYMMYRLEDRRREALSGGLYRVAGMFVTTQEHEMSAFGLHRVEKASVSHATIHALAALQDDVEFVPESDTGAHGCAAAATEDAGADSRSSSGSGEQESTEGEHEKPTPCAPAVDMRDISDLTGRSRYDPATHLKVVCQKHRRTGHAVNFMMAITFVMWTVVNTRGWCRGEVVDFLHLCLAALAVDVVAMQPMFIATVVLYRWLTTDDDGPLPHEAYPIHGQMRWVGLPYDDEESADPLKKPLSVSTRRQIISTDLAEEGALAVNVKTVADLPSGQVFDDEEH